MCVQYTRMITSPPHPSPPPEKVNASTAMKIGVTKNMENLDDLDVCVCVFPSIFYFATWFFGSALTVSEVFVFGFNVPVLLSVGSRVQMVEKR